MKFEYYNPSDDKRSCVVRTMTKLTGKDYDTVKVGTGSSGEEA